MQTVGCWLYKVSNIGTSRGRLTVTEGFSQGNSHHYQWFNVRHKNNSVILAQVFLHSPQAKFLIPWVYLCVYHVNKYFYPDNCPPSATLVDKGPLFQLFWTDWFDTKWTHRQKHTHFLAITSTHWPNGYKKSATSPLFWLHTPILTHISTTRSLLRALDSSTVCAWTGRLGILARFRWADSPLGLTISHSSLIY